MNLILGDKESEQDKQRTVYQQQQLSDNVETFRQSYDCSGKFYLKLSRCQSCQQTQIKWKICVLKTIFVIGLNLSQLELCADALNIGGGVCRLTTGGRQAIFIGGGVAFLVFGSASAASAVS